MVREKGGMGTRRKEGRKEGRKELGTLVWEFLSVLLGGAVFGSSISCGINGVLGKGDLWQIQKWR